MSGDAPSLTVRRSTGVGDKVIPNQKPFSAQQASSGASLGPMEKRIGAKPHVKVRPDSIVFTLLLAAMAALPPLSIDFYLSTLSVIAKSLGSSPAVAGYTISVFLVSISLSQLVFGPLADRFGRRPVGMFGCTLFALSALGCALAHSMAFLLFCRLLQGVGAGAVTVLAFAIVRDLFSGSAANVRYSYVNATMAFVPTIAPVIGSLLFKIAGWRLIFAACAVVGAALAAAFFFWIDESLPREKRTEFSPVALVRNYFRVMSHRSAFGYILLSALAFGAMLSYVTGSSFVFVDLMGMTRIHYGIMLFFTSSGIVSGSFLSGVLSKRDISYRKMSTVSVFLAVAATGALLVLSLTHLFTVAFAVPFIFLTTLSVGLIAPNAAHGVLAPMADIAGTASALLGSLRMLGGSLAAACVSYFTRPSSTPMTAVMVLFDLLAMISFVTLVLMSKKVPPSGDRKSSMSAGGKNRP